MTSVGIVGAGASGCLCAYFLLKTGVDVTLFDYGKPLRTLLPTGGGRCNLAHAEYDFKELVKSYPRGEKFLYSVFSRFSTYDTLSLFEELGVKTYSQEDGRIFPVSNDSKDVRNAILKNLNGANIVNECVLAVIKADSGYKIKTEKADYFFDKVVIATGGGLKSKPISGLEQKIIPYTPSLVGLNSNIQNLSGVVLKNVYSKDCNISDDILFTHYGISGPLAYKISSLKTKECFPYTLTFDLYKTDFDFQEMLNSNPHKDLKNILAQIFPHRFAEYISGDMADIKDHRIDGKTRDGILKPIHEFKLVITGFNKGEETVTSGGYDLNEINPKTMESKIYHDLYIIGEALDIDGFCGGYNLQNAWSTAYIASEAIIGK